MSNNTAKLREALEKALMAFYNVTGECLPECADALSAPPRNCDLYPDARSAREAWEKEGSRRAFSDWLLTAAGKD
jgi:hypothetical protein